MMKETVRVADQQASWMKAFDVQLPPLSDIGRSANLPIISDRSFARTALAAQDTFEGSVALFKDGVEPSLAQRDPRLEQIRRMASKKVSVLHLDVESRTLDLAAPKQGKPVVKQMGLSLERDPTEASPAALSTILGMELSARAKALPQHLRGRMKALEDAFSKVRLARKEGKMDDRGVLESMADISERAFLVTEGGKTPEKLKSDAREGKVDTLFALSAHATRSAARMDAEQGFERGLVSDVMLSQQKDRVEGKRGLRDGDDFLGTSKRLQRLGMIAQDDPRLEKPANDYVTVARAEPRVQESFVHESMNKVLQATKEKALDVQIKHEKPPEATAQTSVSQVGLSGAYLAREFGRDNENAHLDKERESQIRSQFADAEAKKKAFASANMVETAALTAHKKGVKGPEVGNAVLAAGQRANAGVQEVSAVLARPPIQKPKTAIHTQEAR